VLLGVEGGEHYWLVVGAGGVEIDGGGGLGAKVAVTEIEVECADLVGASGAGELHASLDAGDGVMSIHNSSVVFWRENSRHGGGAAKVMKVRSWRSSEVGMRCLASLGGQPRWLSPHRSCGDASRKQVPFGCAQGKLPTLPSLSLRRQSE
jgi:hypothetical protein